MTKMVLPYDVCSQHLYIRCRCHFYLNVKNIYPLFLINWKGSLRPIHSCIIMKLSDRNSSSTLFSFKFTVMQKQHHRFQAVLRSLQAAGFPHLWPAKHWIIFKTRKYRMYFSPDICCHGISGPLAAPFHLCQIPDSSPPIYLATCVHFPPAFRLWKQTFKCLLHDLWLILP